MRYHHATAIALAGWYLLAPPIAHDPGHFHPVLTAPLSEWIVAKGFDTAAECEKRLGEDNASATDPEALEKITDKMNNMGAGAVWHSDDLLREMLNEHCVASDDPRLKP